MASLYYFHDPMCSWCYAFENALKQLVSNLPDSIRLIKILGGLAPDSTVPMPESLRSAIQTNWRKIEKTVPHIKFNYDFWDKNIPIRSTYPACRAVIAANKQSSIFADRMILQIQQAYYLNAENPSLAETLFKCAKQIGLNVDLFNTDYSSEKTETELQKQLKFTRGMNVSSYPSLSLEINNQVLPIKIDYNNAHNMLEQIVKITRRVSWD